MSFSSAKATSTNVAWAYVSFLSTKVLNLVAVIIIARYVDPTEFGLMAICLAIIGYFEIISQFGLGSALISARDNVEEIANAVFYCAMIMSCMMALILWGAADLIANAYALPILKGLLGTIAISLVITASTTVNMSFLYRDLRLRDKILPDVIRGLVKGLVSIALAFVGYGVWALVLGYLAGGIAGSIALLFIRPWRPDRRPDMASIRSVFRYGSHLIGAETINATPRLLDNLLIGKFLGPAALGIYALAFRIPEMGIKSFTTVAGSVLHPVMSKLQAEPEMLRHYYSQSLRYCALLMFGVGALIAVMSAPLVHVLYPPKWYDMVVPMQFIALSFAVSTLNMVPGKLLKAVNRTELLFRVSLINLPMFVLVICAAVPFGITAVAIAQLVLAILRFIPTYIVTRRVLDITVQDTLQSLAPAFLCAAVASASAYLVLYANDGSELVRLLAGTAVFSAAYVMMACLMIPELRAAGSRYVLKRRSAS